ncbi:MAG: alpha-N-arabinofuranosidase [Candidatus Omnitrophica bacterium]|nr:alpha-N-arabinofuranosidase [bacterium]MBV6480750.1 Intracellular exo-alpha-L-arabinofuranosidase 2 [bacterium]MCE7907743.1 alpha-N-arabinofuranosidase [Candidatus Omnitrophica bacterium COP1]MCL4734437.1 alpha-N-arabinofuranosidase [Candidatus Omnitrophota bacterium]
MSFKAGISLSPREKRHTVSRYLYSHFAEHLGRCIYEGIWVGDHPRIENDGGIRCDTIEALKKLELPALRWPGGCFADNYHWMDGIGPREKRPRRHNLWWNQPESNEFGTDEFLRFCRLIGTEPYICLNVGSGTVEEACAWVEYCNSSQNTSTVALRKANGHPEPHKVMFWGVGNENWGCGGNMRPEYYADLYRRYTAYLRGIAGPEAKLIACGSHPGLPDWDERFLANLRDGNMLHSVDYIALHSYLGWGKSDVNFSDEDFLNLIASIDITGQCLRRAIGLVQAAGTPEKKIGVILDEWGTWWKEATVPSGLYQQNTLQDALFAAVNFHLFHELGEWLFMTNMAQTINVLQALILTRGPELLLTPTWHVYEMYKPHREGFLIKLAQTSPNLRFFETKEIPALSSSATVSSDGRRMFLSVVNIDPKQPCSLAVSFDDLHEWRVTRCRSLSGGSLKDHNTFESPGTLEPKDLPLPEKAASPQFQLSPASMTTILFERD